MLSSLKLLIQSRHPLISMETRDEERAVELVREAAAELARPMYEGTMTAGLRQLSDKGAWLPVSMVVGKQSLSIGPASGLSQADWGWACGLRRGRGLGRGRR